MRLARDHRSVAPPKPADGSRRCPDCGGTAYHVTVAADREAGQRRWACQRGHVTVEAVAERTINVKGSAA